MTDARHTKTLGSAAKVIAVQVVTLVLLFALQQAFSR
jgi:hypothetical protein